MKKYGFWYALVLFACMASLTACMNSTGEPEAAEPSPFAMESPEVAAPRMTDATALPQQTAAPAQQGSASHTFNWTDDADEIENRINQISEIAESRVVVNGNTALVGVKFASGYRGEMTERIREMVAAVIMEADPSIETVAVTADEEDVRTVTSIADRVSAGTKIDELAEEIEKIVRNATTMR